MKNKTVWITILKALSYAITLVLGALGGTQLQFLNDGEVHDYCRVLLLDNYSINRTHGRFTLQNIDYEYTIRDD